jgi:hypothetical protein
MPPISLCSPRYMTSSWASCTLFIWTGRHVSLCAVNVTWIGHSVHVYMFLHNLLNVLVQIANKMGLQKKLACVCIPHMLLGNGLVELLPRQIIRIQK